MSLKKKYWTPSCLVGALIVVLCAAAPAQQVTRNDAWVYSTSYGVPVWIAYNDTPMRGGNTRKTLIYIEAQHFSADNIKTLFLNLAAQYKEPAWLYITAFSDKKMLQRAIDNATSGWVFDFAHTPEGRAAATKWAEEDDPLPSGYYRAYYTRIPRQEHSQSYVEEYYSYSADPASPDLTRVVLRQPPVISPYSGNVDSDLLIAARRGDAGKVRSLLEEGAKVNARDERGNTPLMVAALSGLDLDLETVRLLLAKGADVNARNGGNDTALILAASNEETDILQVLLDKGADINHQNDSGYSALIMATGGRNRIAPLKALLDRGADVEVKDQGGDTALIRACALGSFEMVSALVQKGANVNVAGQGGDTPLMKAAASGNAETVNLLLRKGSNVEVRNQHGVTALMLARGKEAVLALVANGAGVNSVDEDGETPLMYAVRPHAADKVQILLGHGADIRARNKKGQTALDIANKEYGISNALLDLLEGAEAKEDVGHPDGAASGTANANDDGQPHLVIKRDPNAQCCEEVSSATISPDGRIIAAKLYHSAFAGNQSIILWDANLGRFVKSISGPRNGVYAIQFTPDGRSIIDEYGHSWDFETGKSSAMAEGSDEQSADTRVYSVAYSRDGTVLVSSERTLGQSNKMRVREAKTGQVLRSFTMGTEVTHLGLTADGKSLAGVTRANNTIVVWDTASGGVKQKIEVMGPAFFDLAYSADGRMLAASMGDAAYTYVAKVFDAGTGKELYKVEEHVSSFAFSADGRLLASAGGDTEICLRDAASGRLIRTMAGHSRLVRSVEFSPDGRFLVSGGGKNETKIWSVSGGELLVTLQAFNDGNWIAYTPQGDYNCSEGATKYIKWQVGTKVFDEEQYRASFFKPENIAARLVR
jgi:ankyrin repeat protein